MARPVNECITQKSGYSHFFDTQYRLSCNMDRRFFVGYSVSVSRSSRSIISGVGVGLGVGDGVGDGVGVGEGVGVGGGVGVASSSW